MARPSRRSRSSRTVLAPSPRRCRSPASSVLRATSSRWAIAAVAVSQLGFGKSAGPPDYVDPKTLNVPTIGFRKLRETGMTREAVRVRSSILRMDRLQCPVLILHGENDRNVPVSPAKLLANRLQDADLVFTSAHPAPLPRSRSHRSFSGCKRNRSQDRWPARRRTAAT